MNKQAFLIFVILTFNYCHLYSQNVVELKPEIDYKEVKIGCIAPKGGNYTITSQKQYESIFDFGYHECTDYKIPIIDFNHNVLIGTFLDLGGCLKPDILQKKIIKDVVEKKYTILIALKQKGICKMLFTPNFWFILPKPEQDYHIEFKTSIE